MQTLVITLTYIAQREGKPADIYDAASNALSLHDAGSILGENERCSDIQRKQFVP